MQTANFQKRFTYSIDTTRESKIASVNFPPFLSIDFTRLCYAVYRLQWNFQNRDSEHSHRYCKKRGSMIGSMILHSMQCPAKAEVVRCRRLLKKVVVDTVIAVLIGLLGV